MTGHRIRPRDERLLTDLDVDGTEFHCCGNEDLVFLRCPDCGHLWVECFECSTRYVNLADLTQRDSSFARAGELVACPSCREPLAAAYLREGDVDRYLPTGEQVTAAGFERYLGPHLRCASPARGAGET